MTIRLHDTIKILDMRLILLRESAMIEKILFSPNNHRRKSWILEKGPKIYLKGTKLSIFVYERKYLNTIIPGYSV